MTVILALFISTCGFSFQRRHLSDVWTRVSARAEVAGRAESYIHSLGENKKILATNPDHSFFQNPYFGYVRGHNQIGWIGGEPGLKDIGNPDVIIVPYPGLMDNFATQRLIESAHVKGFQMRSFTHNDFPKVGYWIFSKVD